MSTILHLQKRFIGLYFFKVQTTVMATNLTDVCRPEAGQGVLTTLRT